MIGNRPHAPVAFTALLFAFGAHGQPGSLDSTFDADGLRLFAASWGLRWFGASALPDTSVVLCGEHWITPTSSEACFTHLLPDGSTDTDWGTNGYTYIDVGDDVRMYCIFHAGDGSYYAAGEYYDGSWPVDPDGILVHLLPDGTPDPAFGTAGAVIHEGIGIIFAMAPWGEDRMLFVGGSGLNDSHAWMMRCHTDGSLDTTFGTGGIVGDSALSINLWDVDVLADGSIVGAGMWDQGIGFSQSMFVLVDSMGVPVPTFGINGMLAGDAIASGGKATGVVAAGTSFYAAGVTTVSSTTMDGYLAKVGNDGTLDPGFNGGAAVLIDRDTLDNIESLIEDASGRILVCGTAGPTVDVCAPMVARYLPSGAADSTFGTNGMTAVAVPGGFTTAMELLLAPDDKLLAAGYAGNTPLGIAFRLEGEGSLSAQQTEQAPVAFSVYPDPVADLVHLQLPPGWSERVHVRVMDATGHLVTAFDAQRHGPIDVSCLARGAYFLSVNDGAHRAVARFIAH